MQEEELEAAEQPQEEPTDAEKNQRQAPAYPEPVVPAVPFCDVDQDNDGFVSRKDLATYLGIRATPPWAQQPQGGLAQKGVGSLEEDQRPRETLEMVFSGKDGSPENQQLSWEEFTGPKGTEPLARVYPPE